MSFGDFMKQPVAAVATKPLVVEVPAPRQLTPMNKDVAASVATLQGHPGFQWLLGRLRLQHALLKTTLSTQRQATLTDVEFLQSGIAWTGWLETQLTKALSHDEQAVPQEPFQSEREAFEEVSKFIEVIK